MAGDLDAERTVSGGDVPWEDMVAAAQTSAPAQPRSDAAFSGVVLETKRRMPNSRAAHSMSAFAVSVA